MKINKLYNIMGRVARCVAAVGAVAVLALAPFDLQAQSFDEEDEAEMEFGMNFSTPQVPKKFSEDIKNHMATIKAAIEKRGYTAELDRNGEVVNVIIPCSDLFVANETDLKDSGKSRLEIFKDLLRYPTMYKILVAVYSDDTGEPDYCETLTDMRANAIDAWLVEIADTEEPNVIPYGMGAVDFRKENNSIANRAANRRAEFSIIPESQMITTARSGKLKSK